MSSELVFFGLSVIIENEIRPIGSCTEFKVIGFEVEFLVLNIEFQ